MNFWTELFLPGRTHAASTLCTVDRQAYIVQYARPNVPCNAAVAEPCHPTCVRSKAEVRGNHLVFLDAKGNFAALFLVELVEGWSVLPVEAPGDGVAGPKRGKACARAVRGQAPSPW
jgi:hypothetical protein